jgi:hypothetical protein
MSFQITTPFVEQFSANVEHLAQQMESRFAGKVREESQQGKSKAFEQLGATQAVKRTSRHADTPRVDSNHQRRWAYLSDYDWSDLVDSLDDVKMLIDPKSSYAQSAAMAMNRAMDEEVIAAATGTAYADTGGGNGAGSPVVLPSTQKIAVNYVASGSPANSGLTLAKLIKAKSILGKAEFPAGSQTYFAYTQQQLDDLLLNVAQVSNADYAAVKALVDGEVSYFMGFNFIKTELLAHNVSTDVRTCFAYVKVALLRNIGKAPSGSVDKRPDKNNAWQVYSNMSVGAARMQEKGVVEVLCDESP